MLFFHLSLSDSSLSLWNYVQCNHWFYLYACTVVVVVAAADVLSNWYHFVHHSLVCVILCTKLNKICLFNFILHMLSHWTLARVLTQMCAAARAHSLVSMLCTQAFTRATPHTPSNCTMFLISILYLIIILTLYLSIDCLLLVYGHFVNKF